MLSFIGAYAKRSRSVFPISSDSKNNNAYFSVFEMHAQGKVIFARGDAKETSMTEIKRGNGMGANLDYSEVY